MDATQQKKRSGLEMIEAIINLLSQAGKIYEGEKRRNFNDELQEKITRLNNAKNARHPDFNRDEIALAEQDLMAFTMSHSSEIGEQIDELKQRLNQ